MRTLATSVVIAILVFVPFAMAEEGHDHEATGHGGGPDADSAATASDGHQHGHVPPAAAVDDASVATAGVIGLASITVFLVACIGLYWRLPRSRTPVLLILVLLALITSVVGSTSTLLPGPDAAATQEFQGVGPGEDPLHMLGFYASFDPATAPQVDDVVLPPTRLPAPISRATPTIVHVTLEAKEVVGPLGPDSTYYYWTYDSVVPGNIIRVRQGDTVEVTLKNHATSTHDHSIDLHAVNGPHGGASATQTPPGESRTFTFEAKNPGFYMYHCASGNAPTHIANQMFGGIIVEPLVPLPPVDREFVVTQSEIYTVGDAGAPGFQAMDPYKMINEQPTYFAINGRPAGIKGDHVMQAETGETIRIYFGNMGLSRTAAFHVIGEQFQRVWSEGAYGPGPWGPGVQTVNVAPGSSLVVDLYLDQPGTYPIVDHALSRVDRGAWGLLEVTGEPPLPPIPEDVTLVIEDSLERDLDYLRQEALAIEPGADSVDLDLHLADTLPADALNVTVRDADGVVLHVMTADGLNPDARVRLTDLTGPSPWTLQVDGRGIRVSYVLEVHVDYPEPPSSDGHSGHHH